jgi:hypothetical protein
VLKDSYIEDGDLSFNQLHIRVEEFKKSRIGGGMEWSAINANQVFRDINPL